MKQSPADMSQTGLEHLSREAVRSRPDASLSLLSARPSADPSLRANVPGVRVCVLCGMALRNGQPMLRVQGSTVHARCSHNRS